MALSGGLILNISQQSRRVYHLSAALRAQNASAQPAVQANYLNDVPHKKHPGRTSLKTQRLPEELQRGALHIIGTAEVNNLAERAQRLANYLWSRKRKVDDAQLRANAIAMEKALWSDVGKNNTEVNDKDLETQIKRKVLHNLRKNTYHWKPLRYDETLGIVYVASRLAGGYAAVRRALHEIKQQDPCFSPQSVLDFGSGLGTVAWASHSLWPDSLKEIVCVDSSGAMNTLADRLLRGGEIQNEAFIKNVYFRQFLPVSPKVQSDLVVGAFALSELGGYNERCDAAITLWRKTGSYLVLLENGTTEGHAILMEARDALLKNQDKVVHDHRPPSVFAPCTHDQPCPKLSKRRVVPCNFLQSHFPLPLTKNQDSQQEKFSYLIMSRVAVDEQTDGQVETRPKDEVQWARLTAPVLRRPRHVHCQLCCSNGELLSTVITARRHGRDTYRCARSSNWGDRLPITLEEDMDNDTTQSDDEPL